MKHLFGMLLMLCGLHMQAQVLQPLGSGVSGKVVASSAAGNEYFALISKDKEHYMVAHWNGLYWAYYDSLNIDGVYAAFDKQYAFTSVVKYNNSIYVGGYLFTGDFGNKQSHLRKWTGNKWEPVLDAIATKNFGISAMVVFDGNLVVAGQFLDNLAGSSVNNIAKFNGTTWSYFGSNTSNQGTDGEIQSLLVTKDGKKLYVSGAFSKFGGVAASNIAFYSAVNGQFLPRGNPFNEKISQLASFIDGSGLEYIAAIGYNSGVSGVKVLENGNWKSVDFSGYSTATISSIAGNSDHLIIGGTFVENGFPQSILRYENGVLSKTGNRITNNFNLGQRENEAFIWGDFTEQNTKISNFARIVPDAGTIQGKVFFDQNKDCNVSFGEIGLANKFITFTSQNNGSKYYAITDSEGDFTATIPAGLYDVFVSNKKAWNNSCSSNLIINSKAGSYTTSVIGLFLNPNQVDIDLSATDIGIGNAKPGETVVTRISIHNDGSTLINGPTIQYIIDPKLEFISAFPTPDNISGKELTFTIINLGVNGEKYIDVLLKIPSTAAVGEKYNNFIKGGTSINAQDINTNDNFDTIPLSVTGNSDNPALQKIIVNANSIMPNTIHGIEYKIVFNNTSASSVNRIVILDTADIQLNFTNVQVTGKSDLNAKVLLPDNKTMVFEFTGKTYPSKETNPNLSAGFIQFIYNFNNNLPNKSKVYNTANAVFDDKWKARSNTTVLEIFDPTIHNSIFKLNNVKVFPNPLHNILNIELEKFEKGNAMILDMQGKIVFNFAFAGQNIQQSLPKLTPGNYILQLPFGKATLVIR